MTGSSMRLRGEFLSLIHIFSFLKTDDPFSVMANLINRVKNVLGIPIRQVQNGVPLCLLFFTIAFGYDANK